MKRGVSREVLEIGGLHAERLVPDGFTGNTCLLYLHGGAYVMGSCSTHRQVVSHIAYAAGVAALIPNYRLAPEHPFPAAVEDAVAVYRWLLEQGIDPADIVIAGDSAGGGLAVSALLSLRDVGTPMPAAVCLLSPWLDLAAAGDSLVSRAGHDPWFRAEDIPQVAQFYAGTYDVRDPLLSAVYATADGLPPVYIQVGDDEILLSDSTRLADNIRAAGGSVELDVWPGMWHVFQAFVSVMPESTVAIEKIGRFVRSKLRAV